VAYTTDAVTRDEARTGAGEYLWANRHAAEERRLRLLEGLADPRTFRLLAEAGVTNGWTCAELGAGGGSVAAWLSQRVGPSGHVIAVDLDTRYLSNVAALANVEVVEGDLGTLDLAPGTFDLVHTRNVLVHVANREVVVERLIQSVRPGGLLVVEEGDSYPLAGTPSDVFARVMAPLANRWHWARHLPALLSAMSDVHQLSVFVEADMLQGATPLAAFWAATIHAATETIISRNSSDHAGRVTAADLDEVLELLADPSFWTPLMAVVCVTATKRSSPS
jgi:SAM-dependent methyltransferase